MNSETPTVHVMVCCNDPRNGLGRGWFDAVHIEDELELTWPWLGRGPVWRLEPGPGARFGRRVFVISAHSSWVGNWCWDQVTMTRPDARELVSFLLERGFQTEAWAEGTDLLLPSDLHV